MQQMRSLTLLLFPSVFEVGQGAEGVHFLRRVFHRGLVLCHASVCNVAGGVWVG